MGWVIFSSALFRTPDLHVSGFFAGKIVKIFVRSVSCVASRRSEWHCVWVSIGLALLMKQFSHHDIMRAVQISLCFVFFFRVCIDMYGASSCTSLHGKDLQTEAHGNKHAVP